MRALNIIAIVILTIMLSACENTATLEARVTDAPITVDGTLINKVNVKISEVSVHMSQTVDANAAGWVTLTTAPTTVDLLEFQSGTTALLGTQTLTAGHYQQLRFTVESAILTLGTTPVTTAVVTITSGVLRLNLDVTLEANKKYGVTLDFDAAKSLDLSGGGWRMAPPVVKVREVYLINADGTHTVLAKGSGATCTADSECTANKGEKCCGAAGAMKCVDVKTDVNNCGSCGTSGCATCTDGVCNA